MLLLALFIMFSLFLFFYNFFYYNFFSGYEAVTPYITSVAEMPFFSI